MSYPPLPAVASTEAAVTELIRNYCGWHVTPVVNEIRKFDYDGSGRLFIPTLNLVDVQRVSVAGNDLYGWSFSADGWLTFSPSYTPPAGDRVVTVDRVKARFAALPAAPFSYQRAGSQAVGYLSRNGDVLGFSLSDSEKAALDRYRLGVAPL